MPGRKNEVQYNNNYIPGPGSYNVVSDIGMHAPKYQMGTGKREDNNAFISYNRHVPGPDS